MSVRICLCSDNHGDIDSIEKIKNDNPACDYYFHLGDSGLNEELLHPFIAVRGNNDWNDFFPVERTFEIYNHRILLMHGSGYTYSLNVLADKAKQNKCDVILFGHTHRFLDEEYKGIRLINPGSCFYNRDMSEPCYAIVTVFEDGRINVERINLE